MHQGGTYIIKRQFLKEIVAELKKYHSPCPTQRRRSSVRDGVGFRIRRLSRIVELMNSKWTVTRRRRRRRMLNVNKTSNERPHGDYKFLRIRFNDVQYFRLLGILNADSCSSGCYGVAMGSWVLLLEYSWLFINVNVDMK